MTGLRFGGSARRPGRARAVRARPHLRRAGLVAAAVLLGTSACTAQPAGAAQPKRRAFPGAVGWAAFTPGGRGGAILRVTTLAARGPGSLAEAIATKGPRIIVFEVGGVIDLGCKSVGITRPFVTVAGQTAPSPGITIVRGGVGIATHDVIVRHVRVRPGEAGRAKRSGWEVDAIATSAGARDVIVDHCSCTWATDENLSASGPRFEGETVEQWRKATSHRITISNCLIAEGLSRSTHAKGAHSKGSLIHDNATQIAIVGNLYAHNVRRNPLFKGGARGVVVNNFVYNPGSSAAAYGLVLREWGLRKHLAGQMALVGNVLRGGPDTRKGMALLGVRGTCEVFLEDNLATTRDGKPMPMLAGKCTRLDAPPLWPEGLKPLPAGRVRKHVLANAGARPWDRDEIDRRILREAATGGGRIIDSEQDVGGYPAPKPTRAKFVPAQWDLATMTRREEKTSRDAGDSGDGR